MVPLPDGSAYVREFSRAEFEGMVQPILDRTMGPVQMALADAGLKPADIDEVVLVGGSTRVPLVRRMVEQFFGRRPHAELNPDEVVALGAAIQADILESGVKNMLLLDVTPLSLGIETMGGVVAKIIPRNSTIPASAQEMFTTGVDNQTGIDIHVLQGERELAADCRSLARFQLRVPPGSCRPGAHRSEISDRRERHSASFRARFEDRPGAIGGSAAELRADRRRNRAHARGVHRERRAGL